MIFHLFSLSCLCCLSLIHLTISSLFSLSSSLLSHFSMFAVRENMSVCENVQLLVFSFWSVFLALLLLVNVCSLCSGELNSSQLITLNHTVHLYIPWYNWVVVFKGALDYFPRKTRTEINREICLKSSAVTLIKTWILHNAACLMRGGSFEITWLAKCKLFYFCNTHIFGEFLSQHRINESWHTASRVFLWMHYKSKIKVFFLVRQHPNH